MTLPPGLFKQPYAKPTDPNRYAVVIGGIIHGVTDPDAVDQQYPGIFNELQAAYDPNSRGPVTSGSNESFASLNQQFQQRQAQDKEQNLPMINSYYQRDLDNPEYAVVSKGQGASRLVPRSSVSEYASIGYKEITDPAQKATLLGYSFNPPQMSAADAANNAAVKARLEAERAGQVFQNQSASSGQNSAENIPPAPPGLLNFRTPTGQIVQLPEAMLQPALNSGFTQVQATGGGTSSSGGTNTSGGGSGASGTGAGIGAGIGIAAGNTTPMDASQYRAKLEAAGIPLDGLDDKQIQTLGMMQQVMQKKAENDQAILPKSLSQADLDSYMATAKDQLDPFYKEQFDLFKNDLLQNVSYLTGETQDEAATREQQFKQQRDQLQQQYVDLGMARSGIRNEAEKQLQASQQGVITSNRRALQQKIFQLGSQLEKTYGAKGNELQPKIESPGSEVAGVAPTTISYQPVGVNYATADQTQKAAEIARQTALATQEAAKRGFIQNGTYAAI